MAKFAKVFRAKFKDGRIAYHVKRADNGRLIAIFGSKSDALKKAKAINKFRAGLAKKKPRKKRGK